ncbi:MAG: hypothetical protein UZ22_OP11002000437 [Microgenomates bacterium OLB23]|nr:MAG: hypothetical protein UZ22_OP11002000437 [Microgenomates bacterium OLB23]
MRKPSGQWDFVPAEDVRELVADLVHRLEFEHIQLPNIFCVRSRGSRTRAYARIWGLSRIFQVTAGFAPTYVIEVLSQHFDKLPFHEQQKVIIHELLHIPKTFSGALLSHKGRYHAVDHKTVEQLFKRL